MFNSGESFALLSREQIPSDPQSNPHSPGTVRNGLLSQGEDAAQKTTPTSSKTSLVQS